MGDVDWASLRLVSCDDVLSKLREVLPDAMVQAQRSAIERGWDVIVGNAYGHFTMPLSDEQIEDKARVEVAIVKLLNAVHGASVQAVEP